MDTTKVVGLLLAVGVVGWLCGCEYDNTPETVDSSSGAPRQVLPPTELVAKAVPYVEDLPVPMGFDLDQSRSRSFRGGPARYVDHIYRGRADKFAIARFYHRQMPIHRWTFVTEMFVQGEISLDFQKDSESCRIVIIEGSALSRATVHVMLWTSGRIEPSR